MAPEGRVALTWVVEEEVLVTTGGVEAAVASIVAASEEEVATEEDSEVVEAETAGVMDQAKWIPGATTDRTDVTGHTSQDALFLRLYCFYFIRCILWILAELF